MDEENIEQLIEESYDLIAQIAENWQSDSPTDQVARAIIGSANPTFVIMEKMAKNKEDFQPSVAVLMLLIKLSYAQVNAIKELDALAQLRKSKE